METYITYRTKERGTTSPMLVHIEFEAHDARTVSIAGTFNNWNPDESPMIFMGHGLWVKNLALAPGFYEYRFVVDGVWVSDPLVGETTTNPFGGSNSVLKVTTQVSPNPLAKACRQLAAFV